MKQLDLFADDEESGDPDAARKPAQKHEQKRLQVDIQEKEDEQRDELGRLWRRQIS